MEYTSFETLPLVLSVGELQEILNIGKSSAYKLLKSGQIRYLKVGSHFRIPKGEIVRFLTAMPTGNG